MSQLDKKHFCMMPWVHMHAFADGRAYPCCFADYHKPIGNLHDNTMKEVWNNDQYRELRRNMMHDKPSSICNKCYEQESNGVFSMRQSINKSHGQYVGDVEKTDVDGTHPEFKLRYWDVRFSNLCNFSCRSCGPVFSSKWYKDHVEMYGEKPKAEGRTLDVVEYAGRTKTDILEQMEEHLPYIDQIYFAGGEPLIMPEHYAILKRLIQLGRTDINLQYNTNFSSLWYKNEDVLNYWKCFSNVSVGASLDAYGSRAELMRKGTKWSQIVQNRIRMRQETPHVDFYISATVSAMNCLAVMDLHKDWVQRGHIEPKDFDVNVLYSPNWYRIDILPNWFKQQVVKPAIEQHLEWLRPRDTVTRATLGFEGMLNTMMAQDNYESQHKAFVKQVTQLDKARGENFWATFPELNVMNPDNKLCILPWISLEASPVGTARPCCLAEEEITKQNGEKYDLKEDSILHTFNSPYMQNLRKEFRDGGMPKTCKKCWAEEAAGRKSKRQNTLTKFKHDIRHINLRHDTTDNLWFLDLKLGNICNLKCRICGSWSSSKWAAEEIDYEKQRGATREEVKQHTAYDMLKRGAWPRQSERFWEELSTLMPMMQYMEFTGGEPFLIEEQFRVLEQAVLLDVAKNIELHYNTNGTVFPEKLIPLISKFKRVEIAFSVDNTEKKFEYERFGANWEETNQVIKDFSHLKLDNSNVVTQLCFTINILNVLDIPELLEWAKQYNFDSIHWNMLHGPEEMSIATQEDGVKEAIVKELSPYLDSDPEYANVINMIRNGKSQTKDELFRKLRQTDKWRKQYLGDTHPRLAEILGYGRPNDLP